jgi:branched-chain amino acid aminotransferase
MSTQFCSINGQLVPAADATIGISDLALQRGYGIFDFFKIINNRPVFLDDHLDRFNRSVEAMHLTVKYGREELKQFIFALIERNDPGDSGIKMLLTGGYSHDGFTMMGSNLILIQSPLVVPSRIKSSGIRIITHQHLRQMPTIKTIDYLMAVWLQPTLKKQSADDVLYHYNGIISECPRANIFIVTRQDKILTPATNILKGVTRKQLLSFSNFNITEADITLEELYDAKEVFITSSTKNVLPVREVDHVLINDGRVGEITTALSNALAAHIAADIVVTA